MPAMPRFFIRTYGCQMNVHDSQKVANLLHHAGYAGAGDEAEADLLIINTCSIREKAEQRLYSDLGALRRWKAERGDRVLAVAGCVAQQEGDALLRRFHHVDFVFGTHNLRVVPDMASAARDGLRSVRTEETATLERFGVSEVDPEGEPFDPEFHEAISVQPSADAEPGSVLTVVQKGYALNGRLLRPARVIVTAEADETTAEE